MLFENLNVAMGIILYLVSGADFMGQLTVGKGTTQTSVSCKFSCHPQESGSPDLCAVLSSLRIAVYLCVD